MKNKLLSLMAGMAMMVMSTGAFAASLDMQASYRYYFQSGVVRAEIAFNIPTVKSNIIGTQILDIEIGTLDAPNYVFPNVQDAIDYYWHDYMTYMVGVVNNTAPTPYTEGGVIYVDHYVGSALTLKASQSDMTAMQSAMTAAQASISAMPTPSALTADFAAKVDKAIGMGLSAESYTTVDKGKVALLSGTNTGDQTTVSGNAGTATALAANGSNCSSGQYARGVDASGNAENCTAVPSVPTGVTVGSPTSRSFALATAYQCTDNTKPCTLTITTNCPLTAALATSASCAGEIRIGSANTVASGASGTIIAALSRSVSGLSALLTQTFSDNDTTTVQLPVGWYVAVRQPTGSGLSVQAAFDQALGL